jgi:NUDIX domain-containing protein
LRSNQILFVLQFSVISVANKKFKIPISVLVVIHTPDLQVLLLERADHPGFWQSVTGSQDEGETLRQTAAREVRLAFARAVAGENCAGRASWLRLDAA